jgi:hypothetical protein
MFGTDLKVESPERVPMLSHCSARELRTVAARGVVLTVRPGDVVRRSGGDGSFLLILSGFATRGDEAVLEAGHSYGAIELLGGEHESDEVRMLTEGTVLVIGAREFSGLFYTVPGFALGVAKEVATRAFDAQPCRSASTPRISSSEPTAPIQRSVTTPAASTK